MPQPKLTLTDTVSIVVVGPESTGKTTLARQLAAHFSAPSLPEYARAYLEQKNSVGYTWQDLETIATTQTAQQQKLKTEGHLMVFFDTDLITLHIWAQDKFGKELPFVSENIRPNLAHLYLLCSPDLPWQPDPLREDAQRREELFTWNVQLLKSLSARFLVVEGHGSQRLENAKVMVNAFLKT